MHLSISWGIKVETLKKNIRACKTRFKSGKSNVTMVFSRGIIISDENTDLITDANMKQTLSEIRNHISAGMSEQPVFPISQLTEDRKSNRNTDGTDVSGLSQMPRIKKRHPGIRFVQTVYIHVVTVSHSAFFETYLQKLALHHIIFGQEK